MFSQTIPGLAIATAIKRHNPDCLVVMGGANCEAPMGPALLQNAPQLDYVFSGPALRSFPAFVECVIDGKSAEGIPGLTSRNTPTDPGAVPLGGELAIDASPPLDYAPFMAGLDKAFPHGEVKPVLPFETSRGCWWGERAHCTFCGLNGQTMAFRTMSPHLALRQFDALFAFGDRVALFECVDNIMPVEYPEQVIDKLKPPKDSAIFYEVKSNLTEREVEILAKGGVRMIQPGVESLATSTLKLMRKGSTAFQNLKLLKNCTLHDIRPVWNLLVGFPGEQAEVYEHYLRHASVLASSAAPHRGLPGPVRQVQSVLQQAGGIRPGIAADGLLRDDLSLSA